MSESNMLELRIDVHEDEADAERIEELTLSMMNRLRKTYNIEQIGRVQQKMKPNSKAAYAFELGSFLIEIAPAVLPALIVFLQHWVGTNRKVTLKTSNGIEVEFTANGPIKPENIIEMIEKLNQIPAVSQSVV